MPSKHAHMSAVSLLSIGVQIIFEHHIIDKSFEIIGLSCADNIVASWFLDQGEYLTCNCGSEHPDSISSVTIADCRG